MVEERYEQINLMLRLYEMRREEKLRKARTWFVNEYVPPASPEEFMLRYPPASEENAYIRMVVSYWDLCSSIFNKGLLEEDTYHQASGEAWVVWEKIKGITPAWRAAFGNPLILAELESYVAKLDAWREKHAPGTTERTRQMMAQLAQARAQAAKK
jgi:hypothetical protein